MSEQMREEFEDSPKFRGMNFTRSATHPEFYESPYANGAWDGWKAKAEYQYTAIDMATAAADGFMDGAEKLKEAYRAGWDASGEGWNGEHPGNAHEHAEWPKARDKALEEIMQQVKP